MFAPHGTLDTAEVALGFVGDAAHASAVSQPIGGTHEGDIFGGEHAEADALTADTAVDLFVALAPDA